MENSDSFIMSDCVLVSLKQQNFLNDLQGDQDEC